MIAYTAVFVKLQDEQQKPEGQQLHRQQDLEPHGHQEWYEAIYLYGKHHLIEAAGDKVQHLRQAIEDKEDKDQDSKDGGKVVDSV